MGCLPNNHSNSSFGSKCGGAWLGLAVVEGAIQLRLGQGAGLDNRKRAFRCFTFSGHTFSEAGEMAEHDVCRESNKNYVEKSFNCL